MFNQISVTSKGLYCHSGGFYIDPWAPVDSAVVTHAHADHLIRGSSKYFVSSSGAALTKYRLNNQGEVTGVRFGESFQLGEAKISFHPAGHVLGSAQVRVEVDGVVWVISGDYKLEDDHTTENFEPIECDVFISEATFGLPIYRWSSTELISKEINEWWKKNSLNKKTTLLCGYSLGKSQRLLSMLDPSIGQIYCHSAIEPINQIYRSQGISLPETKLVTEQDEIPRGSIVIAPPASHGAKWTKSFVSGYASGWMTVRGARARRAIDRGFVISDHADWDGLLRTIDATKAKRVLVTHGFVHQLSRYLQEQGVNACPLDTKYGEEE